MMDYEANQKSAMRLILTDEELQMPLIDELYEKYRDWISLSKESKTRSANRKADILYDQIMSFKLLPIELASVKVVAPTKTQSVDSSADSDDDSSVSRPITRSLRQRCRTPQQPSKPITRQAASPCTPQNQRIRSNMKTPSGKSSSGSSSSNVLTAALNQQHPSVSVTKIRQLLRADSAQKKREEEREKHERMMLDRKAKEERAEALKKQLLDERAANAKLRREQRLQNAAEVRKKREEARIQQKIKEERAKKLAQIHVPDVPTDEETNEQRHKPTPPSKPDTKQHPICQESKAHDNEHQEVASNKLHQTFTNPKTNGKTDNKSQQVHSQSPNEQPNQIPTSLNDTFKKPNQEIDNIEISIHDETTDEQTKNSVHTTAGWTRAPHLREALIKQFSKTDMERQKEIRQIFAPVRLPVELDKIFGADKAAVARYMKRTSSAQWTPPNRAMKRTSSMLTTPSNDSK